MKPRTNPNQDDSNKAITYLTSFWLFTRKPETNEAKARLVIIDPKNTYFIHHVDECLVLSEHSEKVEQLLGSRYKLSKNGDPTYFIGHEISPLPKGRNTTNFRGIHYWNYSLLKGINTDDELIKLKMILMADDVIATVNDETDAAIFHSLISQFGKLSNLKFNPMNAITDPKFLYLGIPLNGLDWERRLKVTLKKIPPLWDKAIEVRTLYINTYVFSTLYYLDQHHSCTQIY
ncbi:unnamed protein product [Ambrosiozyma monospora]|uniref:Unnamed protein product n=1 Tax=Ambrosiozyma monospora TaxID=43982 RepID=A0ACB5T938_AMBMO|nr:unnamed protein product [Ambrosiozyma monospora]